MSDDLVYQGVTIRERGEMICLTDMWRAAGSEENKRPSIWRTSAQAKNFEEALSIVLNVKISNVWSSESGRHSSGTWAHWQISLAYAQYLSPEFHMYCNEIVRAHFEKRHTSSLSTQVELKLYEMLERRVDHHDMRLDQHEKVLLDTHRLARETHGNVIAVREWQEKARLPQPRRFSEEDEKICYLVVHLEFGGKCPIDRTTRLTDDKGKRLPDVTELDHWHGPQYNRIENALPVSLAVHKKLTADPNFRSANTPTFQHFHLMREKLREQGAFARLTRRKGKKLRLSKSKGDYPGQFKIKFD